MFPQEALRMKWKNGYVQMPLHSVAVGNYILRLIIDGQQVDNKPLMVR